MDGFFEIALGHTEARIGQAGVEAVGIQFQRLFEGGGCFRPAIAVGERFAARGMRLGKVGIERQRLVGDGQQFLGDGRHVVHAPQP